MLTLFHHIYWLVLFGTSLAVLFVKIIAQAVDFTIGPLEHNSATNYSLVKKQRQKRKRRAVKAMPTFYSYIALAYSPHVSFTSRAFDFYVLLIFVLYFLYFSLFFSFFFWCVHFSLVSLQLVSFQVFIFFWSQLSAANQWQSVKSVDSFIN